MEFVMQDAVNGLLGGALIGCASALLLLGNGRVAGISGIAAVLVDPSARAETLVKLAFLVGLIAAPLALAAVFAPPEIGITGNYALIVIGGLLVGLGTRIGNGCTSGHGVCGLSRFSTRSLAATLTFMAVAVVVASFVAPFVGG